MDICNLSAPELATKPRAQTAFTLVEVTMAIGIFAFAISAILGLLPLGLTTFRQAMDVSIGSQICQRVINNTQQTDFKVLTAGATAGTPLVQPVQYFDNEGNSVALGSANGLYQVNTVINATTAMPGNATFANLATVSVQIVSNPGNRTIATNSTTGAWSDARFAITTYNGFVARNQ